MNTTPDTLSGMTDKVNDAAFDVVRQQTDEYVSHLKTEITTLQSRISEVESQLRIERDEHEAAQTELQQLEGIEERALSALIQVAAEKAALTARADAAEARAEAAEQALREAKAFIAECKRMLEWQRDRDLHQNTIDEPSEPGEYSAAANDMLFKLVELQKAKP